MSLLNLKSVNPSHLETQLDNVFGLLGFFAAAIESAFPETAKITVPVVEGSKVATGLVNAVAGVVSGDVTPAPVPAAAAGSITAPGPAAAATAAPTAAPMDANAIAAIVAQVLAAQQKAA